MRIKTPNVPERAAATVPIQATEELGQFRRCSQCSEVRPLSDFNWKNRAAGKRHRACRHCTRKAVNAHYDSNQTYYLRKAATRNRQLRTQNKERLLEYLSTHSCVDCGEADPVVLELDHTHDKRKAVAELLPFYEWHVVLAEIEKCVVRCANCHRRRTAEQFGWYRWLSKHQQPRSNLPDPTDALEVPR